MSAERLRDAATLLRERAEAARDVTGASDWHHGGLDANGYHRVRSSGGYVLSDTSEDEAHYIATMDPTVALAVADWLDHEAASVDASVLSVSFMGNPLRPAPTYALAVADAILAGGAT